MSHPKRRRIEPAAGQESVWDYPRPPRCESAHRHIVIRHRGLLVAETTRAMRVLETSHPPVYYIPPDDIIAPLRENPHGSSFCEWKGSARYHDVLLGEEVIEKAGWSYPEPTRPFAGIRDYVAFYAQRFDECLVDGERVTPQPGGFYGGWVTSDIVGPFKGEPGTWGW